MVMSAGLFAGCPGCGGFSGQSGSTALGIVGSMSSGMGDPANFFTLTYSTGSYGTQDSANALFAIKYNLNHWIGLHMAGVYTSSEGDVELPWQTLHYDTSGMGDVALAATFDLTGRTKFVPCPVDGNFLPIKDFLHVTVLAGVSIPTGDYDFENDWGLYPSEYQLGTGTYDPFAGVALFKRWGRWQPQITALYKFSGGENDAGYWRDDAFMSRADVIYFFDPIRKTTLSASVIHSSVRQDERNYNWGPPGFYQEITGTSGDTVLGSLSFGSEIFDRFRLNVSITTSIYEEEVEGVDEKAIGDQYSFGFSYRFGD